MTADPADPHAWHGLDYTVAVVDDDRWEYKYCGGDPAKLNELGADGWRVVPITLPNLLLERRRGVD